MKIGHIAMLARIELTEQESRLFSAQIDNIIGYIDKLNELDTAGVVPTAHVLPLNNVFRPDGIKASLPVDQALQNSPDRADNFYGVPKIIE
ncbi:MAG TPA: Asp-tRNA(Asn)/Glu-tRNA(Gln) amidotransferase subunit GatC [Nitrospirae bacterium]|nr:Asp-tRNA(Asn)/Glu-tRNA(Gln) amidotransferase subunit GatC [Nitrospirota bacterium]